MKVRHLAFLFILGCSTSQKAPDVTVTQQGYEEISLEQLGQSLGLALEDLGMKEAAFNSCAIPGKRTDDSQCGNKHFTLLHFRIQCRDSVGTTESAVTSLDLTALKHKRLEWVIGPYRGVTVTDGDGYGVVRVVSDKKLGKQRFVLKAAKIALGLTLEDVSRIVVPGNWCS